MIDKDALLADLKPQVRLLERDLRERAEQEPQFGGPLHAEWQAAHDAGRTAATYETWLDGEVTQSAIAWVLATVFLRFCEDNDLIDLPYLAGPGDWLAVATERQQDYFERIPQGTDRDWIVAGFEDMSGASPVAAGLFNRNHNPMWRITPSHPAAKNLLAFWRTRQSDGNIVHDFIDPGWDTRFLGDLYQDLSERAKKTYALLQTPEFVEDFILDLTLKPAIDEFGLEPDPPRARPDLTPALRVIDPACGSGHFLLGAFRKLLDAWELHEPIIEPWVRIRRILNGLHGVDKNPFAVSIARFRLLIAVLKASNVKKLAKAHDFPLNIAIADSLLHGRGGPGEQGELFSDGMVTYRTEDVARFIRDVDLLGAHSYHVVVGNPPYITVNDERENTSYRKSYLACYREYSLSVPFTERLYGLASLGSSDNRGSGYIGQITSNSFMKREFGKKLIEFFLANKVNLTYVIDASGAYIPGHGTPTVILIGRNMLPIAARTIQGVLGIRGEPVQPENPAKGLVWRAIVEQTEHPGTESEWISVHELPRHRLNRHPWSLSGGKAGSIVEQIEKTTASTLSEFVKAVGFASITGEDEAYFAPSHMIARKRIESALPMVIGEAVRDYQIAANTISVWPYDNHFLIQRPLDVPAIIKTLWPNREHLLRRKRFGRQVESLPGFTWYEYRELYPARLRTPWSIVFAEVATHNHFVLDRGGKVFKQTAPVIKLAEGATEDEHLALLGMLNSSAVCFWLKQVCFPKGGSGMGRGIQSEDWMERYAFNASNVGEIPIPPELPLKYGRTLDELAQRLAAAEPSAVCAGSVPTGAQLAQARAEYERARAQMIALQEELDWEVYRLYELLSADEATGLLADPESVPGLALGERAFEIVLAVNGVETQWFARHGSRRITEIPGHWSAEYREVVQRRIEIIGRRRDLALIERPEYKRRWQAESWEKKQTAALRGWLLDRCERRELWFAPNDTGRDEARPLTVNRLADRLRADADFVSVARLYAGPDADLAEVIAKISEAEHVPYLTAQRYTDSGLRKRAQWERTWEQQREEDATGQRLNIPVPPQYAKADFRRASFWSNRGKLDVPKERFISYLGASPDGDKSLLLGWAGWDHREQAHALMTVIEDRAYRDGWECEPLIPLIAGLAEVLPWVRQWHGEVDPVFGVSPADAYAAYLDDQMRRCGVAHADLTAPWPPARGLGARPRVRPPGTRCGKVGQ